MSLVGGDESPEIRNKRVPLSWNAIGAAGIATRSGFGYSSIDCVNGGMDMACSFFFFFSSRFLAVIGSHAVMWRCGKGAMYRGCTTRNSGMVDIHGYTMLWNGVMM